MTGIAPWLAIAAAIGLVLIQAGGIAVHLSRVEARLIGLNISLLALAIVAPTNVRLNGLACTAT